jgi:hypothetical protein
MANKMTDIFFLIIVCIVLIIFICLIIYVCSNRRDDNENNQISTRQEIEYLILEIEKLCENNTRYSLQDIKPFVLPITNKPLKHTKTSKGEEKCRAILEELFPDHEFKADRPDFLRNPRSGHCLELDMVNYKLNLALEYNGEQHYVFPNNFHKNKEEYLSQVERDMFKMEKCREMGLNLMIIPYLVSHDNLRTYILNNIPEQYLPYLKNRGVIPKIFVQNRDKFAQNLEIKEEAKDDIGFCEINLEDLNL